MIAHLGPSASKQLLDLVSLMFQHGDIPDAWRQAIVYPIPKPHEWESQLKNTRPITLLETARKCFVKLFTNRLSTILYEHGVLQGGNFAGLPGGSCQAPIHVLDSLITDSLLHKKPLWVLSQDISKAFDSVSLPMLDLAMARFKIPSLYRQLIINLFTNRTNSVLTAFDLSSPYRVKIGIDQGETISPLLWVIYYDPLLTELQSAATDPYCFSLSSLNNVLPVSHDSVSFPVSSLVFMDDSTLVASSKEGMESLLSVTEEFYALNNTAANHSKYVLTYSGALSTSIKPVHFQLAPSPLYSIPSLSITPIGTRESFRFLGVWFNLSGSSHFQVAQATQDYKSFTSVLFPKLLTDKQLVYLHNSVLVPKVAYRLQTTFLSEAQSHTISSGFKRLFKSRLSLPRTTPDFMLFLNTGYGLVNLYKFLISSHLSTFSLLSNSSLYIAKIFSFRLAALQRSLWLCYSPLYFKDWDSYTRTVWYKWDFIANVLGVASRLAINFAPTLTRQLSVKGGSLPLSDLFGSSYRPHSASLRFRNILFLSQLLTTDGLYLLRWGELAHSLRFSHLGSQPRWDAALKALLQESTTALELNAILHQPDLNVAFIPHYPPPLALVDKPTSCEWLASLTSNNQVLYGRAYRKQLNKFMVKVSHWLPTRHPSSAITPNSGHLLLSACPGCSLSKRKPTSTSKKASHACYISFNLHRTLRIEPKANYIHKVYEGVDLAFRLSPHSIRLALVDHVDGALVRAPSQLTPDARPPYVILVSPWMVLFDDFSFRSVLSHVSSLLRSCSELHFYSDGSLSSAASIDMVMGYGWTCYSPDQTKLASFSAATQGWPSSTRAEVSALISIFVVCPPGCKVYLYMDSQATIDGLSLLTTRSANYFRSQFKRPNYLLWAMVAHLISSRGIMVHTTKIKAHSGNAYNDEADALAKRAAASGPMGLPDLRRIGLLPVVPTYHNELIDINLSRFLKQLYQSELFASLLSAGRFRHQSWLHESQLVDWTATWAALAYNKSPYGKRGTSSSASQFKTFKSKMFLGLLPLLELLKTRRPDLYAASLSCVACSAPLCSDASALETWDHLWTCPSRQHIVSSIILQTKNSLIKSIRKRFPDANTLSVYRNLCWNLSYLGQAVGALDFCSGLVPTSLIAAVQLLVGSLSLARELVAKALFKLHQLFFSMVWKPRCTLFQSFKESWGITHAQERTPLPHGFLTYSSSVLFHRPTRVGSFTSDSYIQWTQLYMKYGNSWMDFRISLNR